MIAKPRLTKRGVLVDPATSLRMGRVRQHGTSPELIVRSMLYAMGHRFRTSNRDLPGSPDIANRRWKWAVFVHGCFWHRHKGCVRTTTPKRNRAFWMAKFRTNQARDRRVIRALKQQGFRVVVVWECETDECVLLKKLRSALGR